MQQYLYLHNGAKLLDETH